MIYSQGSNPIAINTSLGEDVLLLEGFRGREGMSELFHYELDLLTPASFEARVEFDKLLGSPVGIRHTQPDGGHRFVHGIVLSLAEADRDDDFVSYHAEVVPRFWLLTRTVQSRVFTSKSVPDILKEVLAPLRPDLRIDLLGAYPAREFCVQYQESDFAFASRLMEEEGIGYYFVHEEETHRLVLTDSNSLTPELAPGVVRFHVGRDGSREPGCIWQWRKKQSLRSGKVTLRDTNFELRGEGARPRFVEGRRAVADTVKVGSVDHRLRLGVSEGMERVEYPGGFGRFFDGIAANGNEQTARLSEVEGEASRYAKLRGELEAGAAFEITGQGECGYLTAGHRFELQGHPTGAGRYLVKQVEHTAKLANFRSDQEPKLEYHNRFVSHPEALPYRPARQNPTPTITGVQTAVVVGPAGLETFTDRYGRIKVQFAWDRQGRFEADRSCWIRVAQTWAGRRYGAFFWPRPGHEVVVAFEDGDPNRPLVVGSVYNAANMPPIPMPEGASTAGFKSCTVGGNPLQDCNALVFHDEAGTEHLYTHSVNTRLDTMSGMRLTNAPGPSVEVFGSLPLPVGSGSGGGYGFFDTIYPLTMFQSWGKPAHEVLNSVLPGNTSLYMGDNLGGTLVGSRFTHVIGLGGESKTVAGASVIPALGSIPGLAGSWGLSGTCDLFVGNKTGLIYKGYKVDITRGDEIKYKTGTDSKTKKLKDIAPSVAEKAAVTAAILHCALAFACDLAAGILGGFYSPADPKDPAKGISRKVSGLGMDYANALGLNIQTRVLAVINAFEMKWAQASAGEVYAKDALKMMAKIADLLKNKPNAPECTTFAGKIEVIPAEEIEVGQELLIN